MDRYATLRNGLVGAWCPSLDNCWSRLRDWSNYRANPTVVGFSPLAVNGGQMLSGNGTSALANIGDYPQFRIPYGTITGWFRVGNLGAGVYKCIFASYAQSASAVSGIALGINISAESTNQLGVVVGKNTGTGSTDVGRWYSSATVTDSVLHSFACVIAADGTVAFYVDGVSTPTTKKFGSAVTAAYATTNYVGIGAEQTGPTYGTGKYWPGLLDDIRVYSRVLSDSEIKLLASRRGIGLVPQRVRRFKIGSQFYVNASGTWKTATPWIKVGGVWKQATPALNVSGTWK